MTREQKENLISDLAERLGKTDVLYVTDIAGLDAESTSKLRRLCFSKDVRLQVVKNTLLQKAIERVEGKDFSGLSGTLVGNTGVMISTTGNAPAKLIKEFRKKQDKPFLKGAYVEEAVYIGDDQLEALVNLKSREELIGDIILLLQSPAKNVISGLKSGGGTLAGLVKTLSERNN